MRDLFVTVAVMGSLPFILYRPYIGILMWSWISYMNPHRISWGFATDFPFAMVIAITTLLGMLFSKQSRSIPWTRETRILAIFIIWMGITTLFAFHPELAQEEYIKIIKIQLMTFVTMMLIRDRQSLYLLLWVIVISLGFYGVKGGLFTIFTGGGYHVLGPPGTFIGGNNEMGLALIMTVPLMWYLSQQARQKWMRIGLIAAMFLTLIAILGTQSRGALLGLLAMALFLVWKSNKRVKIFISLLIALSLGFMFMPQKWHDRMYSITNYQQDTSAMGRINAWRFAINLAMDHPLVGGGNEAFESDLFAKYAPDPEDVHDAHSIYFQVLAEHGFIGLMLFLSLGFFAWRSCTVLAREAGGKLDVQWVADLSRMVQVSLVGYAVSGAFLGLAYFDFYYHLLAVVIILKSIIARFSQKAELASVGTIAPALPAPRS